MYIHIYIYVFYCMFNAYTYIMYVHFRGSLIGNATSNLCIYIPRYIYIYIFISVLHIRCNVYVHRSIQSYVCIHIFIYIYTSANPCMNARCTAEHSKVVQS